MDEVFPVALSLGLGSGNMASGGASNRWTVGKEARVEKILSGGRYEVLMPDGTRLEVSGRKGLRKGDPVRVTQHRDGPGAVESARSGVGEAGQREIRGSMSVWLPLLMGAKEVPVRLEIFLPEKARRSVKSEAQVVTFVFDVTTRALGWVQWGVHLKGRELALQIYAESAHRGVLQSLAARVVEALTSRGFSLSAPTTFRRRPFEAPAGTLSVKG